jgi:sec-independent protein translocase protein TatC
MSITGHLRELRRRGTRIAIAILVGAVAGWLVSGYVWDALRSPVSVFALGADRLAAINFTTVTAAFDLKMQLAVVIGIVVSSPVWLYQVFAFFLPALTRVERRYTVGFVAFAVPLFLAGCAAGWFVMPHIVELMLGFAGSDSTTLLSAKEFLDFALKLVLVTGVAFVLPVFLVLLNFVGVVSAAAIRRSWRVAIVAITAFTALATPAADVLSMLILAVPMVALYFSAVAVTTIHDRRSARRLEQAERAAVGSGV